MEQPVDAAFAIIHDGENMLCVTRKDGRFGLPGGKVESGETPIEAVARELSEEIGYHTSFASDSFIGTYDYPTDGRKIHVFELDVGPGHFANILGRAVETVYLGDELSRVNYMRLNSIEALQEAFMPTVFDSVKDLLKKHGNK